jgi:hypothetical protein
VAHISLKKGRLVRLIGLGALVVPFVVLAVLAILQKPLTAERALELAQWKFNKVAAKHNISASNYYPIKLVNEDEIGFDFSLNPRSEIHQPIGVSVMKTGSQKIRVFRHRDKPPDELLW